MTRPDRRARGAFTLVEMMVAMVVLAVIGASLIRILVLQSHLFQKGAAQRASRVVARSAMNMINSDLRMLEPTAGVVSASSTSLVVRSPFALGIVCGAVGGGTVISLAPVDSTEWANAALSGYAWRDTLGAYHYQESGVSVASIGGGTCNAASITTLGNGKTISVSPALPAGAVVGTPVLFEEQVKYEFKASVAVPGTIALWRTTLQNGTTDELVAPFTSAAGFRFFVLSRDTSQAAVPSPLSNIRGIEFVLAAQSATIAGGATAPESTQVKTAVYFRNSLN